MRIRAMVNLGLSLTLVNVFLVLQKERTYRKTCLLPNATIFLVTGASSMVARVQGVAPNLPAMA